MKIKQLDILQDTDSFKTQSLNHWEVDHSAYECLSLIVC